MLDAVDGNNLASRSLGLSTPCTRPRRFFLNPAGLVPTHFGTQEGPPTFTQEKAPTGCRVRLVGGFSLDAERLICIRASARRGRAHAWQGFVRRFAQTLDKPAQGLPPCLDDIDSAMLAALAYAAGRHALTTSRRSAQLAEWPRRWSRQSKGLMLVARLGQDDPDRRLPNRADVPTLMSRSQCNVTFNLQCEHLIPTGATATAEPSNLQLQAACGTLGSVVRLGLPLGNYRVRWRGRGPPPSTRSSLVNSRFGLHEPRTNQLRDRLAGPTVALGATSNSLRQLQLLDIQERPVDRLQVCKRDVSFDALRVLRAACRVPAAELRATRVFDRSIDVATCAAEIRDRAILTLQPGLWQRCGLSALSVA